MSHLISAQRYTIAIIKNKSYTQKEIAKTIEKDKSAVRWELSINRDLRSGEYRFDLADRKYAKQQKLKRKKQHFTEAIKSEVKSGLEKKSSPK
jgi:IS30 family transposase